MNIVDLGCGNAKKGNIGIDITKAGTQADYVCNLGFDPIPLDDDSTDKVIAHHFVEHVPFVWFDKTGSGARARWKKLTPMIFLFDEVYRILKPNGTFEVTVPIVVAGNRYHQQAFQDPTHVTFWTPETVNYFSGDYFGFHATYGHKSRFEKIGLEVKDWYMEFVLRAVKDRSKEAPYLLTYDRLPDAF